MLVLHRQMDRTQTHRYFLSLLLVLLLVTQNSEWILDTGATYHVCPNRDWFSSFEKLDGSFTIMGDDHPCNVEEMGTFRIKMDDGIVRELKEVRYVPQLKKNLISVGTLKILGLVVIYTRWCSQDDQRLNGVYERRPPK